MGIGSRVERQGGKSGNQKVYSDAFRGSAHRLILMGYERLDAASHQNSDEEDISGELVRVMNEVIQDDNAEDWLVPFSASNESPVDAPGRTGKSRRVDIMIVMSQRGPHPQLQFEAKRLYNNGSARLYLGEEGLGRFLSGKYAHKHEEAGMLGYVQTDDEQTWADRIQARLDEGRNEYAVCEDGLWNKHTVIRGPRHTYLTRHNRTDPPRPIAIYHIFLRFF